MPSFYRSKFFINSYASTFNREPQIGEFCQAYRHSLNLNLNLPFNKLPINPFRTRTNKDSWPSRRATMCVPDGFQGRIGTPSVFWCRRNQCAVLKTYTVGHSVHICVRISSAFFRFVTGHMLHTFASSSCFRYKKAVAASLSVGAQYCIPVDALFASYTLKHAG